MAELIPMNSAVLLSIGLLLGGLNYYIGCFFVGGPFPSRLKRWGWALIYDGCIYVMFMFFVLMLPWLVGLVLSLILGRPISPTEVSTELFADYYVWLGVGETTKQTLLADMKAAYNAGTSYIYSYSFLPIVGRAAGTLAWNFINPMLALLSSMVSIIYILHFLGAFIQVGWLVFIGYGAILYGLPARVGRRIGAAMVCFSIIFYLGLPLMPAFAEAFTYPGHAGTGQQLLSDASQAEVVARQMNSIYGDIKRQNVMFTVTPKGGEPWHYQMVVSDGSRVSKIWTASNGVRPYHLPVGNYHVTEVKLLDMSLSFTGQSSFTVSEGSVASVALMLDIYGMHVNWEGHRSPAFLDFSRWRETSFHGVTYGSNDIQVNVYSITNNSQAVIFFTTQTRIDWYLDGEPFYPSLIHSTSMWSGYSLWMRNGTHNISMEMLSTEDVPKPGSSDEYKDEDPLLQEMQQDYERFAEELDLKLPVLAEFTTAKLTRLIIPLFWIVILMLLASGLANLMSGRGDLPLPGI